MREIKFRWWIPNVWLKEELYPKQWHMYYWGLNFQSNWVQLAIDNNTIMQYTWLKDKNGKMIYEGDILSWLLWGKWDVFYRDDMWLYELRYIGWLFEINTKDFEIIWNIFENPEFIS